MVQHCIWLWASVHFDEHCQALLLLQAYHGKVKAQGLAASVEHVSQLGTHLACIGMDSCSRSSRPDSNAKRQTARSDLGRIV